MTIVEKSGRFLALYPSGLAHSKLESRPDLTGRIEATSKAIGFELAPFFSKVYVNSAYVVVVPGAIIVGTNKPMHKGTKEKRLVQFRAIGMRNLASMARVFLQKRTLKLLHEHNRQRQFHSPANGMSSLARLEWRSTVHLEIEGQQTMAAILER